MTRTVNFGFSHAGFEFSERLRTAWPWIWALDAFDYGDRTMLADLFEAGTELPPELRPQIAAIIKGERKPNMRAAAKLKVRARDRMEIASAASVLIGIYDKLNFDWVYDENGVHRPALEIAADRKRVEQIQQKRLLEARVRAAVEQRAQNWGISVETVEDLVRALRKKLRDYPMV